MICCNILCSLALYWHTTMAQIQNSNPKLKVIDLIVTTTSYSSFYRLMESISWSLNLPLSFIASSPARRKSIRDFFQIWYLIVINIILRERKFFDQTIGRVKQYLCWLPISATSNLKQYLRSLINSQVIQEKGKNIASDKCSNIK